MRFAAETTRDNVRDGLVRLPLMPTTLGFDMRTSINSYNMLFHKFHILYCMNRLYCLVTQSINMPKKIPQPFKGLRDRRFSAIGKSNYAARRRLLASFAST